MRNVWIEHTTNPGDLSDGGWNIETLNIEDCGTPLNLNNARVVMRHINLQAGRKSPMIWPEVSGYRPSNMAIVGMRTTARS